MMIIGDKKTYCFEGIHLPRIYIQDKTMARETERVRSEDIRRILYFLWRLGFGIEVTKIGRAITSLPHENH